MKSTPLKPSILIIGFGRFGQVLAHLLKDDFNVLVTSRRKHHAVAQKIGVTWVNLKTGIREADTIFYAVPISQFEPILTSHLPLLKEAKPKLIIDVLSVKLHPQQVLRRLLPHQHTALLTHPLFGPDSLKSHGLPGLKIMIDQFTSTDYQYRFWRQYFRSKKLEVIELSAKQHDQLAANSQGVVFFLGHALKKFGFTPTPIDTYWSQQLGHIFSESVGNDTLELFQDLQNHNPFTKLMRQRLIISLQQVSHSLARTAAQRTVPIYGIQGGVGSFNHQTLLTHLQHQKPDSYRIKYLYTTKRVLRALDAGDIDFGLFAIQNTTAGLVQESIEVISQHTFSIKAIITLSISHHLMKLPQTPVASINTIISHPQSLKQCATSLKHRFGHLKQTSGTGRLIDHALAAKQLAAGKLPPTTAILGPRILADLYHLDIFAGDLQDAHDNRTTFMLVSL